MTTDDSDDFSAIVPILRDESPEDAEEIVREENPDMPAAEVKAWAKRLRGDK